MYKHILIPLYMYLAGISDTPPRIIDFYRRQFSKTWHGNWNDIDVEMERSLLHYSFDGILFQYNDITPPWIPGFPGIQGGVISLYWIPGFPGFYRKELM